MFVANPSVFCLSSVVFMQPTQRIELFGNIFAPSDSLETRIVCVKILGFYVIVQVKCVVQKMAYLDKYFTLVWKRYEIWP